MAMQNHLAELERRHQALEREIAECRLHPSTDPAKIAELKKKKLTIKDQITRLRSPSSRTVH
jgi:hypothetical protein